MSMNVEMAIHTVVDTFQKSAGRDGRINKQEFCKLVRNNLGHFLSGTGYDESEKNYWGRIMRDKSNENMSFDKYLEFVHTFASDVRKLIGAHQASTSRH